DACGVECQASDLQRETQAVVVFQRAIKHRLAIWRRPDDLVGCIRSNLDPVALRVDEVKKVLTILRKLAADQSVKIEVEAALDQCRLVLSRDRSNLICKNIHGLEKTIDGFRLNVQCLFKVGQRFVADRSQAGGHDE